MSDSDDRRILALDVGKVRIGVAISDAEETTASPLTVLERKGRDATVRAIGELAAKHRARLLVVGLPKNLDESLSPEGEAIFRLGKRLMRALGLKVVFVDEASTTVEATDALLDADMSRAKRREVVDKVAAALILQRYLDGDPGEEAK